MIGSGCYSSTVPEDMEYMRKWEKEQKQKRKNSARKKPLNERGKHGGKKQKCQNRISEQSTGRSEKKRHPGGRKNNKGRAQRSGPRQTQQKWPGSYIKSPGKRKRFREVKKYKTFGWCPGKICNIADPDSGRVLLSNMRVISDPFLFYGNKREEIALMVKGIRGAVPLDYITEPVEQQELILQTG